MKFELQITIKDQNFRSNKFVLDKHSCQLAISQINIIFDAKTYRKTIQRLQYLRDMVVILVKTLQVSYRIHIPKKTISMLTSLAIKIQCHYYVKTNRLRFFLFFPLAMRSVKTQIFSQRIERLVKNNDNK